MLEGFQSFGNVLMALKKVEGLKRLKRLKRFKGSKGETSGPLTTLSVSWVVTSIPGK